MQKKQKSNATERNEYVLIYNPNAGSKRKILPNQNVMDLEGIKNLLDQYQIPVKLVPTKYAGHATILAKEFAQKNNLKAFLVAGGDGTVGEAANGLVGSDIPLGILPLGSVMNVARMLNIPQDMEKAVMLIKIGRMRKIDLGAVTMMSGEKMGQPYYFIESAGIGLEAQLHAEILKIEKGDYKAIKNIFKILLDYYGYPGVIKIDDREIKTRATLVTISNGPLTGAALPVASSAKLNDHHLTVSLFKMSKWELFNYFMKIIGKNKRKYSRKVETYEAQKVRIETKVKRLVHADARLFGETPVEFTVNPNALTVIAGFPTSSETSLVRRTLLDP